MNELFEEVMPKALETVERVVKALEKAPLEDLVGRVKGLLEKLNLSNQHEKFLDIIESFSDAFVTLTEKGKVPPEVARDFIYHAWEEASKTNQMDALLEGVTRAVSNFVSSPCFPVSETPEEEIEISNLSLEHSPCFRCFITDKKVFNDNDHQELCAECLGEYLSWLSLAYPRTKMVDEMKHLNQWLDSLDEVD